jgi:hypothetical protein
LHPQTFIVKILIIGTNAETGFYSRMERRGIGQAACRNSKRVRVWGCVLGEKTRLASKVNASKSLLCELLLFTNLFI